MKAATIAAEACAPSEAPARSKPRPRFILVDRPSGCVVGDFATAYGDYTPVPKLTPTTAPQMLDFMACDTFPYRYRRTSREAPDATFDVYRAAPDYPAVAYGAAAAEIEHDCEYVATITRIYPRCCFCRKLMEYHPWQYGHDAAPLRKGRACDRCYVTRVLPAHGKAEGWSQQEIDERCRHERDYLKADR